MYWISTPILIGCVLYVPSPLHQKLFVDALEVISLTPPLWVLLLIINEWRGFRLSWADTRSTSFTCISRSLVPFPPNEKNRLLLRMQWARAKWKALHTSSHLFFVSSCPILFSLAIRTCILVVLVCDYSIYLAFMVNSQIIIFLLHHWCGVW